MKKAVIKTAIALALVVSLLVSVFAYGCGGTNTYDVIFSRNCDDEIAEPETQKVEAGKTATKPDALVRKGYEFLGWFIDEDGSEEFDFSTAITEETFIYAKWEKTEGRSKVTFDANGGTGAPAAQTVNTGSTLTAPTPPTKEGKAFGGWCFDKNGTQPFDMSTPIDGNMTLYAKWLDLIDVTFNLNYTGSTDKVEKVGKGLSVAYYKPERSGYIFAGWFTDASTTTVYKYTAVNAATTLYAKWAEASAQKFTYTFKWNYTGAPADTAVEVVTGGVVQAPDTAGKGPANKVFKGWYTDAAGTTAFDIYTLATANVTIYAAYKSALTVTFDPNYNRAVKIVVPMEEGQTITKPDDPTKYGWEFLGWSTVADAVGSYYTFGAAMPSASLTLYAQWNRKYNFEAEDVDVSELQGWGFSGDAKGANVIISDTKDAGASNGYYTYCLNSPQLTLDFKLFSDRAAKAKFRIRLSAEIRDIKISSSDSSDPGTGKFTIKVNDVPLDYGTIEFTGVPSQSTGDVLAFKDFLEIEIDIKKGENHIMLVVDNNKNYQGGTMKAIAPMVDCIKLETQANIRMEESSGNY